MENVVDPWVYYLLNNGEGHFLATYLLGWPKSPLQGRGQQPDLCTVVIR